MALARGARTRLRMMRMWAPVNTASKAAVNGLSRPRIKNRNRVGAENPDMARDQGVLSWLTVWVLGTGACP
jgi:hypothetical protein